MTDQNAEVTVPASDETDTDSPTANKRAELRRKADTLGIAYHPNIGDAKLLVKIRQAMKGNDASTEVATGSMTKQQQRMKKVQAANALVRVIITCMNPAKQAWEGEIFTVSNSVVGTIKKFVPFNNTEGWHVPRMLLNMIEERKCQLFLTERQAKVAGKRTKTIKEFTVIYLDNLTPKELKELAQRQAMANGVEV